MLWSIAVPLALIVPPAIAIASQATSLETNLAQDLAASGMVWPFFMLIVLSNYVSVALFWKRIQDADEARFGGWNSLVTRWGYGVLTLLNTAVIGLGLIALDKIEGSFAGIVLIGFWGMACWARPHNGPNSSGPDPREGGVRGGYTEEFGNPHLDAAMQRALNERNARTSDVLSPKLVRPAKPAAAAPVGKPSFGRRGV